MFREPNYPTPHLEKQKYINKKKQITTEKEKLHSRGCFHIQIDFY